MRFSAEDLNDGIFSGDDFRFSGSLRERRVMPHRYRRNAFPSPYLLQSASCNVSVTLCRGIMKQKDDWRNKLDSWALEFLERRRKASAERGSGNPAKWHEKMAELAAKYPQIRELRNIEVLPEFLSYLFQNEDLAKHLPAFNASTGTKTMDAPLAKSVDIALIFALALGDTQLRVLGGFGIDFVALVFGKVHSDISKMYFGDAGPSSDKLVW